MRILSLASLGGLLILSQPVLAAGGPDCLHETLPANDRASSLRSIEHGGRSMPRALGDAIRSCGTANGWSENARLEAVLLLGAQLQSDDAYRRTVAAGATPAQLETVRQRLEAAHFEVTLEGLEGDGDGTPLFEAIAAAGLRLDGQTTEPLLEWLVLAHDVRAKTAAFAALQ